MILRDLLGFFWKFWFLAVFSHFLGQNRRFWPQKCEKTAKNQNFQKTPNRSLVYQKLGHFGHFWPFSDHFSDFFKFWEYGHFLYALDFLGGPGTINRQKIEICLRYFAGLLEPSKTIYLLKIKSFQAFLVILWDF